MTVNTFRILSRPYYFQISIPGPQRLLSKAILTAKATMITENKGDKIFQEGFDSVRNKVGRTNTKHNLDFDTVICEKHKTS